MKNQNNNIFYKIGGLLCGGYLCMCKMFKSISFYFSQNTILLDNDLVENYDITFTSFLTVAGEYFLVLSIFMLTIYGVLTSKNFEIIVNRKKIILISSSNTIQFNNIAILILIFYGIITYNQYFLYIDGILSFSNSIYNDFISLFSKLLIIITSIFYLLIIQNYLIDQKLCYFEYYILILSSVLGFCLLCCSNDFLTAYLAIELQSLSLYVLAAFKKNSTYSVESGIKYFILGALSTSIFLLGVSLVYGISGTINFMDLKDLFMWIFSINCFFFSFESIIKAINFFEVEKIYLNNNYYFEKNVPYYMTQFNTIISNFLIFKNQLFFNSDNLDLHSYPDLYLYLTNSYDIHIINNHNVIDKNINAELFEHYFNTKNSFLSSTTNFIFRNTYDNLMFYHLDVAEKKFGYLQFYHFLKDTPFYSIFINNPTEVSEKLYYNWANCNNCKNDDNDIKLRLFSFALENFNFFFESWLDFVYLNHLTSDNTVLLHSINFMENYAAVLKAVRELANGNIKEIIFKNYPDIMPNISFSTLSIIDNEKTIIDNEKNFYNQNPNDIFLKHLARTFADFYYPNDKIFADLYYYLILPSLYANTEENIILSKRTSEHQFYIDQLILLIEKNFFIFSSDCHDYYQLLQNFLYFKDNNYKMDYHDYLTYKLAKCFCLLSITNDLIDREVLFAYYDSITKQFTDFYNYNSPKTCKVCAINKITPTNIHFDFTSFGSSSEKYLLALETHRNMFIHEDRTDLSITHALNVLQLFLKGSLDYNYDIINTFDTLLIELGIILILISLFFKLALTPFHLWSPDIYEGAPSSSSFFFIVVSKISIFVFLIKICYLSFYSFIIEWQFYSMIVAILSILLGSITALKQRKLKSLLTYSSISNMGLILSVFSTGTFDGLKVVFYYFIIYIISSLSIWSIYFLVKVKRKNNNEKYNKDLGDFTLLHESNKTLSYAAVISIFSIAGIPPMIGFLAKVNIFLTLIISSMYFIAFINIVTSVVSTFYYIRIIKIIFFEKVLVGKLLYPINSKITIVQSLLFFLILFIFINPTLINLFSYKTILFLSKNFY
jgi:NADH:ubiquinone oxidoreductase subunit 2 (subunit N)